MGHLCAVTPQTPRGYSSLKHPHLHNCLQRLYVTKSEDKDVRLAHLGQLGMNGTYGEYNGGHIYDGL